MLLASCWFECLPDTGFDDSLRFLLEKLLISAKLDPFAGGDVLLDVDRSGEYRVLEFPNVLEDYPIHPTALDFLTQQREWPVSWNPLQLKTLGTIEELGYVDDDEARECIAFWVTSTFEDVEKYLQKKLALLRKFLAHDGCVTFNSQHLIEDAIHSTIHNAAEVIALLSEHDYYGQGPPWLRHRFKKLVRIGAFILATLTLLLNFGRTHLADQPFLDRISRHAQSHNARIFCIWRKAFREVSRGLDSASFNQSSNDCYIDSQTATSIDEQNEVGPSVRENGRQRVPTNQAQSGKLKKSGRTATCWTPRSIEVTQTIITRKFRVHVIPALARCTTTMRNIGRISILELRSQTWMGPVRNQAKENLRGLRTQL